MAHPLGHFATAVIAAAGFVGPAATAIPAAAQPLGCGPRPDIVVFLEERFGERPIGVGLIGDHTAFELHVSESGSWTMLSTGTDGRSCMVAAGHGWTRFDAPHDESAALTPRPPAAADR